MRLHGAAALFPTVFFGEAVADAACPLGALVSLFVEATAINNRKLGVYEVAMNS